MQWDQGQRCQYGPHTIKGTSKPSKESWALSTDCRLQGERWDPQAQYRTPKAIFNGMHWGPLKMHTQRPCRTMIKPCMGNIMQIVPFLTSVLYWWKREIRPLGESWKSITHREYVYCKVESDVQRFINHVGKWVY